MISFFGIIHLSGGCGPELLGAIRLLRSRGVPVRCIVPEDDPVATGERALFLRNLGVDTINYRPGLFEKTSVLVSFGEESCFDYMRRYSDRPKFVSWSGGMSYAVGDHARAISDGLVDESFFQTTENAESIGPELTKLAKGNVKWRRGYTPYIDPDCDWLHLHPEQPQDRFSVLKVVRDDPDKWHPEHWRMAVGVSAPSGVPLHHQIVGWGPNAADKVGNPCDPSSKWAGLLDVTLTPHVYDPQEVAGYYRRAHVLLHYYPFVESFGFATAQAMLAGCVQIGADEGGFRNLIQHGETGWLANSPDEAAYYASKMAFEPDTRDRVAEAARSWVINEGPGNADKCWPWWEFLVDKAGGG